MSPSPMKFQYSKTCKKQENSASMMEDVHQLRRIDIVGNRLVEQNGKEFMTYYTIFVFEKSVKLEAIRYRQFREFYSHLCKKDCTIIQESFPPKHFRSLNASEIVERSKQLHHFMSRAAEKIELLSSSAIKAMENLISSNIASTNDVTRESFLSPTFTKQSKQTKNTCWAHEKYEQSSSTEINTSYSYDNSMKNLGVDENDSTKGHPEEEHDCILTLSLPIEEEVPSLNDDDQARIRASQLKDQELLSESPKEYVPPVPVIANAS